MVVEHQRLRFVSVLPEGYRFWVLPNYRLETPTVCVELPRGPGCLLAMLLTSRGRPLSPQDLADGLYLGHEDGGPESGLGIVRRYLTHLRQRLRAVGVDVRIEALPARPSGYVFRGFSVCQPTADVPRYLRSKRQKPKLAVVNGGRQKSKDLVFIPEGDWMHNARTERVRSAMARAGN